MVQLVQSRTRESASLVRARARARLLSYSPSFCFQSAARSLSSIGDDRDGACWVVSTGVVGCSGGSYPGAGLSVNFVAILGFLVVFGFGRLTVCFQGSIKNVDC